MLVRVKLECQRPANVVQMRRRPLMGLLAHADIAELKVCNASMLRAPSSALQKAKLDLMLYWEEQQSQAVDAYGHDTCAAGAVSAWQLQHQLLR